MTHKHSPRPHLARARSAVVDQFRERPPQPPPRAVARNRRTRIAQRAAYLQGTFLVADPASLARELTDEEREESVKVGQQAGANWAARRRGLM